MNTMKTTTGPNEITDSPGTQDVMAFNHIAGFFIVVFIVGIIGNSIVIYVLFRKRRTWNISTTYLFNLAVADAIFVCTLPLWAHSYLNRLEWKFGLFMCKLVGVAGELNMYASIFFLTAMSVDRWIAVVHATTINTARSSVVARVMCVVVWLSAAISSVPRMMYQEVREYQVDGGNYSGTSLPPNMISDAPEALSNVSVAEVVRGSKKQCMFFFPKIQNKEVIMGLLEFIQAVVGFVIPMVVICVCYLRIVRTVRLKLISRRVRKERVAVLAGIIVAAFFLCWLPRQLMTLYSAVSGWWDWFTFNEDFYHQVYPFCVCLAYANSCVNPFVYAFTATNFKNSIREVCGSNITACKDTRAYKLTLAHDDDRPRYTPNKGTRTETKKDSRTSTYKKNSRPNAQLEQNEMSSTDDIYEALNPADARRQNNDNIGAEVRDAEECQRLAIEDTTSGICYEYFSSPAVLQTGPEVSVHKLTTRADIINHSNREHQNKTHLTHNDNETPKLAPMNI